MAQSSFHLDFLCVLFGGIPIPMSHAAHGFPLQSLFPALSWTTQAHTPGSLLSQGPFPIHHPSVWVTSGRL